jgi:predicted DCC family thiol-disulfide oxidoreductase YuxK
MVQDRALVGIGAHARRLKWRATVVVRRATAIPGRHGGSSAVRTSDGREKPNGVFLYDADCGFCTRLSRVLDRISARGSYDVTAWQRADLDELGLTPQACSQASWFVTRSGTAFRGSDAIARALMEGFVPLRPVGALLTLPGLRTLSRAGYGWVARNRHRMPGSTDQCRVPSP